MDPILQGTTSENNYFWIFFRPVNNFQDNRNRVAVLLNDSTNNQLYSTNLIALRHVNNPGNSALNNTKRSKEKKAGVFPIRYIAVLGFWHRHIQLSSAPRLLPFQSAISRYLGSDRWGQRYIRPPERVVSIRYIAVLGFQLPKINDKKLKELQFQSAISRYLVSNLNLCFKEFSWLRSFNPLYRGTWFPTF